MEKRSILNCPIDFDKSDFLHLVSLSVGYSIKCQTAMGELVIGNKITVSNTYATVVMNQEAPLLLGGSVFTQFREVSVDREEHIVKFYKY